MRNRGKTRLLKAPHIATKFELNTIATNIMENLHQTRAMLVLTCILYLLTAVEMRRDLSSPYNDPCGGSATQAHYGDIAVLTVGDDGSGRQKRGATAIRERLWPGARIPYEIDGRYNSEERNLLYRAMSIWEASTCIRFYERPEDHNASYIYIFKGGCCASYVGRQTTHLQQGVSLGAACMNRFSTLLHELGHVIGFWHEQSRPDRDDYISILRQNLMPGTENNFQIEEQINSLGIGYDYNSIMHYSSTAFGAGRTTIEAHDSSIPVGGAINLSELDIMQANLLYQCDTNNFPPTETPTVSDSVGTNAPPPLPECNIDFVNQYSGIFFSNQYPQYSHNQDCVYRISLPEGTKLNVTVVDLDLEWSQSCTKDSLTIYNTMDGSGHPQWYSRCGRGSNMTITMDTTVAYVTYVSDGENIWAGNRGFLASFNAEDINECKENNGGCSQRCVNLEPGYTCQCDPGWFLSDNLKTCFDINECAIGKGGCQHKCNNSGGSFTCDCPEGSELNADGKTCTNPERSCDVDNGGCDHICWERAIGVSCHCREGYRLLSDGETCVDINECVEGHTCSYGGCRNTPGSYHCVCSRGYGLEPNTTTCINVDECARGLHLCEGDAMCQDTDGSYECTCPQGLRLSENERNCIDIDECRDSSTCSHGCVNTYGSYICTCPTGYQLEEVGRDSCVDTDECLEGACSTMEGSVCVNTNGSYECMCCEGYTLSDDEQTCEDIDECLEDACSTMENSVCVNTNGSYECECITGYRFSNDQQTCEDIDECSEGACSTMENSVCVNNDGSYECQCSTGYTLSDDQQTCEDINECLEGACSTVEGSTCMNTGGSYECQCSTGHRLSTDQQTCEDINECVEQPDYCSDGCSNTDGSFDCTCNEGYMLNDDGRTCKCGGRFTAASGSFSTPGWPTAYPQQNMECEWIIDLPNPEATIHFTIDDSAYGINGRAPCSTDYIVFYDGVDEDASEMHKLCKFDIPDDPIMTSSSQARVVFSGTKNRKRPASRVGVQVMYNAVEPPSPTISSPTPTSTSPPPSTDPPLQLIDECAERNGGCEHICVDTAESYYCECRDGYALEEDSHSCHVSCGGILTEREGSFQTPDWPARYPQENFVCEWRVRRPLGSSQLIQFTVDGEDFGINGRPPCSTDYLQFFNGPGRTNPNGDKHCFLNAPTAPTIVRSEEATIIFKGTKNSRRPASRVGAKVNYRIL